MALAERIKECRKNTGLSQAELAERLLVSRQAVTKIVEALTPVETHLADFVATNDGDRDAHN